LADEFGVGRAGAAAQPVVEVGHRDFPEMLFGQRIQRQEQYHRIHTARDGDEDFLAARQQTPLAHVIFDPLKEFAHADSLLGFGAAGKQRDG
jgi:hypothetical protein